MEKRLATAVEMMAERATNGARCSWSVISSITTVRKSLIWPLPARTEVEPSSAKMEGSSRAAWLDPRMEPKPRAKRRPRQPPTMIIGIIRPMAIGAPAVSAVRANHTTSATESDAAPRAAEAPRRKSARTADSAGASRMDASSLYVPGGQWPRLSMPTPRVRLVAMQVASHVKLASLVHWICERMSAGMQASLSGAEVCASSGRH